MFSSVACFSQFLYNQQDNIVLVLTIDELYINQLITILDKLHFISCDINNNIDSRSLDEIAIFLLEIVRSIINNQNHSVKKIDTLIRVVIGLLYQAYGDYCLHLVMSKYVGDFEDY